MGTTDKVIELVDMFLKLYPHPTENYLDLDEAIKCVLICIDREISLLEEIEYEFIEERYCLNSHRFILIKLSNLKELREEIIELYKKK